MTVHELIRLLQDCDPNAQAVVAMRSPCYRPAVVEEILDAPTYRLPKGTKVVVL